MSDSSKHEIVSEIVHSHLSSGNQIRFWVTSNSMKPLLKIGDAAIAETATLDEIKIGDIIIIQREDDFLTHRLIAKSPPQWLTKGDNNLLPDPPARTDLIAGRVIGIQHPEQTTDLQTREWQLINPILAKFSFFEWKFFLIHRYLRLPFRAAIKTTQKLFMP